MAAPPVASAQKEKTCCVFLIDRTGSMSQWINAVREILPSLVHSVALTGVFTDIGIVTYSDYDLPKERVITFSKYCSTTNADHVAKLEKFAGQIPCEGGAGLPEAFKTALVQMASHMPYPDAKRIHVVHLTDAPPHCLPNLDKEGKKEQAALGDMFDWFKIVDALQEAHPTLRYHALCTTSHPLYCHLAQCTGGDVHTLQGGVSATNIRTQLGRMMNGWLGFPDPLTGRQRLRGQVPETEALLSNAAQESVDGPTAVCPVIRGAIMNALKKVNTDGPFREHVIAEMKVILNLDVLALTVSPIVGKLWRELCKARADPRRDEMIELLSTLKNKLAADDKKRLEEWLTESYNASAEIDGTILDFMKDNETHGLLRFVPEDDSYCAQQAVQLLARGDAKSTTIIRAILSRFLVDTDARVPRVDGSEEAAAATKPAAAVVAEDDVVAPLLKQLSTAAPHFKTALVVLPPEAVALQADKFRADHDQAFGRWMPHITIMFPFIGPEHFSTVTDALQRTLSRNDGGGFPAPFRTALNEVSWFPGRKSILHVVPETSHDQLKTIYDTVLSMFPHLKRADRDGYQGHLTLGQCSGQEAPKLAKSVGWTPAEFTVDAFHLIHHAEGEDAYKIIHTFDLPRNPTKPRAAPQPKAAPLFEIDEEDAAPPLPAHSIPLNMPVQKLFELAMHTVAPGTKLTRRYAALFAMHALQCGSVLAKQAEVFLREVQGKWINWRRRDDDAMTAEVPENFSGAFLYLITDPAVVEAALTDAELAQAKSMLKVLRALKFWHSLEVPIQMLDPSSADGVYPDHGFTCMQCAKCRPLCLIAEDGICGYCKKGKGEEAAESDVVAGTFQVRCHTCGAFYARDRSIRIPGHSKCHGCQKLGKAPPTVQCTVCKESVVQFYRPEVGLPKGGRCGPCANNLPPRRLSNVSHNTLAHQLFAGKDHFKLLCRRIGIRIGKMPAGKKQFSINNSVGLCDAVLLMHADIPAEGVAITCPQTEVEFRERRPDNAEEVWAMVADVMDGKMKIEAPECAVCLSPAAAGSRLVAACGRKGCTQRVCLDCSRQWYGMNAPGKLLYDRALLCQFCARVPAPYVIRAVSNQLVPLVAHLTRHPLELDCYHGWCRTCLKPSVVAVRACADLADGPPQLEGFECADCQAPAAATGKAITVAIRECPRCTVATEKDLGCNHMECPCGAHWCWLCGRDFEDPNDCYNHLDDEHGGIFDNDGEYNVDDEE